MKSIHPVALAVLFTLVPCAAFGQSVTPTETQSRYNNEGVLEMQNDDYESAVARFQSSLALGELNITYLNLGRSYFRLERCLEAREAYDRVEDAPAVESPTTAEISAALEKFRADLDEACTATVVFQCDEPSRVAIDDSRARRCEGELEWPVTPGTHTAVRADAPAEKQVEVGEGESVSVQLVPSRVASGEDATEAGPEMGTDGVKKAAPPADDKMATKDIFGWFAIGSGAVLLLTYTLIDFTLISDSIDNVNERRNGPPEEYQQALDTLESQKGLNRIVLISGATLAVVGTALFLWPEPEDAETVEVSPVVGPENVGVSARVRW